MRSTSMLSTCHMSADRYKEASESADRMSPCVSVCLMDQSSHMQRGIASTFVANPCNETRQIASRLIHPNTLSKLQDDFVICDGNPHIITNLNMYILASRLDGRMSLITVLHDVLDTITRSSSYMCSNSYSNRNEYSQPPCLSICCYKHILSLEGL